MTTLEEGSQSTVEWLELFFDLVVVAAVAVLTEGLREDPALFALLYGAVRLDGRLRPVQPPASNVNLG